MHEKELRARLRQEPVITGLNRNTLSFKDIIAVLKFPVNTAETNITKKSFWDFAITPRPEALGRDEEKRDGTALPRSQHAQAVKKLHSFCKV